MNNEKNLALLKKTAQGIDFINCLVTIPFTVVFELIQYRLVYDLACKTYMFLITSTVPFSAYIMVGIAVDRYLCICHPLLHIFTVTRAKRVILLLTIPAFVFGILTALSFGTYVYVEHLYLINSSHYANYTGEAIAQGQDADGIMGDDSLNAFLNSFSKDRAFVPDTTKTSRGADLSSIRQAERGGISATTFITSVWAPSSKSPLASFTSSPVLNAENHSTPFSAFSTPTLASKIAEVGNDKQESESYFRAVLENYGDHDDGGRTDYSSRIQIRRQIEHFELCTMNHIIFSAHFSEVYKKVHALNFLLAFIIVAVLYTLIYKSIITRRANKEARRNKNNLYIPGRDAGKEDEAEEAGADNKSGLQCTLREETQLTSVGSQDRKGSGSTHSSPACTNTTTVQSRTLSRASSRASTDSRNSLKRALKIQCSEGNDEQSACGKNTSPSPVSSPSHLDKGNQRCKQMIKSPDVAGVIYLHHITEKHSPTDSPTEETSLIVQKEASAVSFVENEKQSQQHCTEVNGLCQDTTVTTNVDGSDHSSSVYPKCMEGNGSTKEMEMRKGCHVTDTQHSQKEPVKLLSQRTDPNGRVAILAEEQPLISKDQSASPAAVNGIDQSSPESHYSKGSQARRCPSHKPRLPKKSSRKIKGEKRDRGYKKVTTSNVMKSHKEGSNATNSIKRKRPCHKHQMYVANIKTALMLLVVTTVFIIAFLPSLLMANGLLPMNLTIFYSYFVYHVTNPFIYAFMNQNFRDDLKKILSAACGRSCARFLKPGHPITVLGSASRLQPDRTEENLRSQPEIASESVCNREERRRKRAMKVKQ
ncbi:orexin receptor type 2 [Plakobranchus ocellatus]|uniref:Orexin receptor type 2 n=1 Tax=Plakobranchus ocellatus TaxID=259542 RepID=A0AAV4B9J8_9GAST|nr:orexin receptor type 2 [Plakobranchus ocellatus]